jgi:hypothetical protein
MQSIKLSRRVSLEFRSSRPHIYIDLSDVIIKDLKLHTLLCVLGSVCEFKFATTHWRPQTILSSYDVIKPKQMRDLGVDFTIGQTWSSFLMKCGL